MQRRKPNSENDRSPEDTTSGDDFEEHSKLARERGSSLCPVELLPALCDSGLIMVVISRSRYASL